MGRVYLAAATTPGVPKAPDDTRGSTDTENLGAKDLIEVGQWYWVKDDDDQKPAGEWLACVVLIGSNFVKLEGPNERYGGTGTTRIHLDVIHKYLRRELHAREAIQQKIADHQRQVAEHMAAVKAITARLGISTQPTLEHRTEASSQALVTLSSQTDVKAYKKALIRAEKEELPALFEAIKKASEKLSTWMTAETIPLKAISGDLKKSIDDVKDRIFNVTLYAGLTEEVVRVVDGAPAAFNDRLHLFQRRAYMDEECISGYLHGGIDFKKIGQFDKWLVRPENRDRILPFPRCMVAFKVRHEAKDREWEGSLENLFVNIQLGELDKLTFLYIRNGEQVYRLNCDLEFGELIFPDKVMFDPSEPMMVKMSGHRVDKMMTVREYEDRLREYEEREAKSKQWIRENPVKEWRAAHPGQSWDFANPYRDNYSFNPREWRRFDRSNVYYDECVQEIAARIKQYNRIALIVQGLFDRSEVLHPHPPVHTWTPEGFATAIELVYDGSAVLHHGEAPDFEAYRERCNASLNGDSIVVGQDHYWQVKEAEKESRRLDRDWRNRSEYRPKLFKPYGNEGPGIVARIAKWHSRTRRATFTWFRDTRSGRARTTITVPAEELFNVSAYKLGRLQTVFPRPAHP